MITICQTVNTYPKDYQTVSVEQLQEMLENGQLPVAYEVITAEHKQVHPYFDLDLKTNEKTLDPDYYLAQAKQFLDQHFKDADYAFSSSNRPTKISYHMVVTNYMTAVQDLKNLSELPEFKKCHLDPAVYRIDNSKFRLISTSGEKSDSVPKSAINYEESITHHLVTYFDPEMVYELFECKKLKSKITQSLNKN